MKATRLKIGIELFTLLSGLEPRLRPLANWYSDFLNTIEKWYLSEGNQGVSRAKQALGLVWSLALGSKPEPMAFTKSDGLIPDCVKPFAERVLKLAKDERLMSAYLTIVRVTDLWEGQLEMADLQKKISVIRDSRLTGTARKETEELTKFAVEFFKHYRDTPFGRAYLQAIKIDLSDETWISASRGPNGPLSYSSHRDVITLRNSPTESGNLLASLERFGNELTKPGVCGSTSIGTDWSWVRSVETYADSHPDESWIQQASTAPGKLGVILEKSGKTRIVAMPDYFTQKYLRPVHDWLFSILRKLPMDCTFDQKAAIPKICEWQMGSNGNGFTASFDQSSCTDLFPFVTQLQTIIAPRFGEPFCESLKELVADREWSIKLPNGLIQTVRWGVGQPLGMYGSWGLMALTHHILVQYSYWISHSRQFPKDVFSRYVICGDDIVIGDRTTAEAYRKVCHRLGLKINEAKSHVSGKGTDVSPVSEFAKITIWRGKVLFPIKPKQLAAAFKDTREALPLIAELTHHGQWAMKPTQIQKWISSKFQKESRVLNALLALPSEFGGIGLKDARSLERVLKDSFVEGSDVHPYIYYLASKIRAQVNMESISDRLSRVFMSSWKPSFSFRASDPKMELALNKLSSFWEEVPGQLASKHPIAYAMKSISSPESKDRFSYMGRENLSVKHYVKQLIVDGFSGSIQARLGLLPSAHRHQLLPWEAASLAEKQLEHRLIFNSMLRVKRDFPTGTLTTQSPSDVVVGLEDLNLTSPYDAPESLRNRQIALLIRFMSVSQGEDWK